MIIRGGLIPRSLSHLILLVIAVTAFTPIWIMFVTSFKDRGGWIGFSSIWPFSSDLTFDHYIKVWKYGNFARYFLNSFFVTFLITVGNLIFDSLAAYALARKEFFLKKFVMTVIVVKLMIPSAVLMVPTFILVNNLGLYDTYAAMILPMLAETFGIFLIRQYMLGIPKELEEAARLEGAGEFRIFMTIILPLCLPVLMVVLVHSVMTGWNMYIYPLILTSSDSLRTLPLGLAFYRSSHSEADAAELMACSVIAALPVILVFIFFQKKIISGLTEGAVKG